MNARLVHDASAEAHGHAFVDDVEDDEGALQEELGEGFAGKIPRFFFATAFAHHNKEHHVEKR